MNTKTQDFNSQCRRQKAGAMPGCIAALALVCAQSALAAPESYRIDSDHTIPGFEVTHLGLSTVRGLFQKTTGKITLDRAAKTGYVEIVIYTASVVTKLDRRDKLIREWFKIDQFPNMVYRSNNLKFAGDDLVSADGELTLLGVTRPVSLNLAQFKCIVHPVNKRQMCGADGSALIKRSEFGMTFLSNVVGDDVKILFGIETIKE
jgi:polyisoprenoid-binding protein YceI